MFVVTLHSAIETTWVFKSRKKMKDFLSEKAGIRYTIIEAYKGD